jgi:hypothetical protein
MNPFRVTARSLCESFYEALNPVSTYPRSAGSASPERGTDQSGVFGTESDAMVFHGGYDPIVGKACQ